MSVSDVVEIDDHRQFSLSTVARRTMRRSDHADPDALADAILDAISPLNYREALGSALRPYAAALLGVERREALRGASPSRASRSGGGTSARPSAKSQKRNGYWREMAAKIYTGERTWKPLSDCTYDDLLAAASLRDTYAEANASEARKFRGFASLVLDNDVPTFGALPAEVLTQVFI